MTPLDHALAYAALGWRVVPIPPGQKYPVGIGRWQDRATTDVATIRRWWTGHHDLGVAIATGTTSGVFVVDVDSYAGGDDTWADLCHQYGPAPTDVESLTGGGGLHLVYALPPGVVIPNNAGTRLGPGLDVRGEGGQIVAPPTHHPIHACKRCAAGAPHELADYRWEASSDPTEGARPSAPPQWLVDLLVAPPEPPRPRRDPERHSASERPGDRFEAETEWADLLTEDGWTLFAGRTGRAGDYELWTRPGKDPKSGASASLYWQGADVLKVFTSSVPGLTQDATYTRFGYYAATRHGGDHKAAATALGAHYRASAPASSGTASAGVAVTVGGHVVAEPRPRPVIVHNGRHLEHVAADAITALVAGNAPERYFVRSGQLVRVRADESGRPIIETLSPTAARLALADAAAWFRCTKDGDLTATSPPIDIANAVIGRGDWPLPALAGVVELPVIRPDGTFAVAHGYDHATRLYHWHRGVPYDPIPTEPTPAELAAAVALIDEALCDFAWDTTADRANAWALLLTPLVRSIVPQVPMALVDAPSPGTGKGLLVQTIATITIGREAAVMSWPTTEEELEKKATAALMAGTTMVIWDNVEGVIRSGTMAAVLTAQTWQGRVLGRSEMVMVPNRATWCATGNNIDIGGDLARRCYRIRLDARLAQPWRREGFRHDDQIGWVTANRGALLGALCTIVAAWWAAGRPLGTGEPAMGGYTPWVRTVGGILANAGVVGFLTNLDAFHADADQDARQWEAFLTAWWERYDEAPLTTAELVEKVRDFAVGQTLREVLPETVAGNVDHANFVQKLGKALRARTGRHYGEAGIHLVELPRDRRRVAIWSVTTRPANVDEPAEYAHGMAPVVDKSTGDIPETEDLSLNVNSGETLPREKDQGSDSDRGSGGVVPFAARSKSYPQDALKNGPPHGPSRSRDSRTPARPGEPPIPGEIDPTRL